MDKGLASTRLETCVRIGESDMTSPNRSHRNSGIQFVKDEVSETQPALLAASRQVSSQNTRPEALDALPEALTRLVHLGTFHELHSSVLAVGLLGVCPLTRACAPR